MPLRCVVPLKILSFVVPTLVLRLADYLSSSTEVKAFPVHSSQQQMAVRSFLGIYSFSVYF